MNAKGPLTPVPLLEHTGPLAAIAPRSVQLIKGYLPESTSRNADQQWWQLKQRYANDQPWISTYAFTEIEFFPNDFEVMNWYINTHPRSWFTQKLVVGKMLLGEDGRDIIGDLTLYDKTMRRRICGQVDLTIECDSEDERVLLLQQYFGISLDARERRSISGTASEIP